MFRKAELMSPNYYLDEAKKEAKHSNCEQTHWGAVIVDWKGTIIGRGFNIVPHEDLYRHCKPCIRTNIRSCTQQEKCMAIHAEVRAIQDVYKSGNKIGHDTDMYIYGYNEIAGTPGMPILIRYYPCMSCALQILASGIRNVWMYRPIATNEDEKCWLPFPKHEQDYNLPYMPDWIRSETLPWFAGVWIGIEGHELALDRTEVVKLGKPENDKKLPRV